MARRKQTLEDKELQALLELSEDSDNDLSESNDSNDEHTETLDKWNKIEQTKTERRMYTYPVCERGDANTDIDSGSKLICIS